MISIYQKSPEETLKQVLEKWETKKLQLILLEIPDDQYDQVVILLKKANLSNLEQVLKHLVRSPFSFDQIKIIIDSGFLLNYEEDDEENETDYNNLGFIFEGQFFLSSYLIMYYYQNSQFDYKASRKAAVKALKNDVAISTYISKLIKSSKYKKISYEMYKESKSQNYQLEQADLKGKLFEQISGAISSLSHLQQLIKSDSKVDKALSLIMPTLENKVHIEQAETVAKGLEQYLLSISFNLLFPKEIEVILNEFKQLPFERFLRQNIASLAIDILKKRQPININPNHEFLLYEIVNFTYYSVFCENEKETIENVLDKFKNKSILMIEVCPEQYKQVIIQVCQRLNISQKEAQKRISISQITQEQISLMVESGYILNFLKEEHKKVMFQDSQFLSFVLVVFNNHKKGNTWEESVKSAVMNMIAKMHRRQIIKISEDSARRRQLSTFVHPVLKEMIKKMPFHNKVLDSIFSNNKLMTSTSKMLRDNIITTFGVSFLSAINDLNKLVQGSLSKKDFLMNQIKNVSWTGIDVLARTMGVTMGPVGNFAGKYLASQVVDFSKSKLESILPYTIAERASILFEQYIEELTQDILTNDEVKGIINEIKTSAMTQFLRQINDNAEKNIDFKLSCKNFIKKLIIKTLQKRKPILIGKDSLE